MYPMRAVTFLVLVAVAAATDVQQCVGRSFKNLSDAVHLSPCKKVPCRLKQGTDQHITIKFTPDKDITALQNSVSAEVFGVWLPFVGVDGKSICDKIFTESGIKTTCPLKAGETYMYKDLFPIHNFYPKIETRVSWILKDEKEDIICFQVPARIV